MIRLAKPVAVLGLVGAMALAVATPSEARNGRNAAAIGAGVAGFAIGAAAGARRRTAARHNGYYYGGGPMVLLRAGPCLLRRAGVRRQLRLCAAPRRYYGGDPSGYYAPNYRTAALTVHRNGPRVRITSPAPARASSTKLRRCNDERAGLAPAFSFVDSRQPVERALQDEDRGVLVDHGGALACGSRRRRSARARPPRWTAARPTARSAVP